MRKLILKMSMTIDGFVAGANGEVGWVFQTASDEGRAWTIETIGQAGVHIMGAKTFRDMAAYWPSSTEPFAAPMNTIPKVVFSRTSNVAGATTRAIEDARANATSTPTAATPELIASWTDARVASGPLADEIARLKREPGGPIMAHGGATFAQSLVQHDLVDEYRLLVHPVALGRGLPLFSTLTDPRVLDLIDVKRFAGGGVAHVYARRAAR